MGDVKSVPCISAMRIFVASMGRSGTVYMCEVIKSLTSIPSFNEYRPHCLGNVMNEINNLDEFNYLDETVKQLEGKMAEIRHRTEDGVYFESGSSFIRSYVERVLEEFDDACCVYLPRDPVDTRAAWYTRKAHQQEIWHLKSHWKKNLLRTNNILGKHENFLWEWFEIRQRYYHYKPRFKKTFEFDFRDIESPKRWKEFFTHFGIEHDDFNEMPDVDKNK